MKIYIAIAVMLLTFERSVGMLNLTTGNGDNDFPEESACDGICDCHEETGEHLYVNCTSRNLTRVPSNIPDSVVYLNLSWNNLQLVEGDFAEYESLQILNVAHSHLRGELPRIFRSLEEQQNSALKSRLNIRMIVFSYNRLRVLPKDLFDGVTLLDTIEIDFNHIAQLPEELFSNLIMLRILTLASNRIRNLPEGLFRHNTDLWSISFKNNNLETLPQNLLKTLDRLIHLDLSGNRLIRLPEFLLEHSRYARFLYFSENRLQEFPKNVFSKRLKIVELDISHNNLTLIAEDMFGNVELRDRLDLSNNFIKTIPTRLFHWKNRYHRLSHLFLNYNQLTSLQRNVFIGLYQLKSICLFGNKIASIDPLVFASDTLDTVYLFNNELVQLSYGWFTENSTTAIHVYGNKIQNIHGQFITNIRSNNTLYINCSNLIEVQRMLTKMTCVTSLFAPEIQLQPSEANKLLAKFFQKEGFTCHENAISSNISCKACPRGTYSNGANECIRCPRGGFYQDEIGKKSSSKPEAMNCKKCPKGRFVVAGGGRSQGDCVVCPDGTIEDRNAGFRACLCKDEFARRSRFGECYQCPQKGIICTGQDFQSLKPGYFWSWNFSNANLSEYSKFVLNLRTKNNSYDNRTCSYVKEIPRVHKCQRLKSCRNDLKPSIESKCGTGHTGWLCNKCQKGFYTYLTRCLPCPATVTVALELILVPCLVVGFCYILRKQYETNKSRVRERKTQVSKVVSRAKVLLGFYQVVGIYLVSFHNLDWNINLLIVGKLLSFFEMNVFNTLMKSDCFHWNSKRNAKVDFALSILLVLSFTLIPFVYYVIVKLYLQFKHEAENLRDRLATLKDNTSFIVVLLLFIVYLPVCKNIFQLYPWVCKTFCLDQNNTHCFTVLQSDFDVQCDSHLKVYHAVAIVLSVFCSLSFPLLLFYLLNKYYRTLLSPNKRSICSNLKEGSRDGRIAVLLSKFPAPTYVLFLSENYKEKFWYWGVVELVRKVSQTVLIIWFGWENKLAVLLTIASCILFLTLDASFMPIKVNFEQYLQTFSLVVILINALFLGINNDITSGGLAFLNMSLLLIIFLEIILSMVLRVKHVMLRPEKECRVSHFFAFTWKRKKMMTK